MTEIYNKGAIEFICGCMFSGKTDELIRRIRRVEIANLSVQVFKPYRELRTSDMEIRSRSGAYSSAITIPINKNSKKMFSSSSELFNSVKTDTSIVAIDEIQFFDEEIVDVCDRLANKNKRVIIAGLILDFRGEPFGQHTMDLLAKADQITFLTAICEVCGKTATRTQRLVNGKPAKWDDPIYLVGGQDTYKAVCREHHVIEKPIDLDKSFEYKIVSK